MSKKKKKKNQLHSSVLDEPVLGSKAQPEKEADADGADTPPEPPVYEPGGSSATNVLYFEDESISDLPSEPSDTREIPGDEDLGGKYDDGGGSTGAGDELEDDFPDEDSYPEDFGEARLPLADRLIQYASVTLSVFMLGASIVFWFVMLRYLILCPYILADSVQIKTVLVSCAVFSAVIAAVQHKLRRPVSPERWLVCLCLSCALATAVTVIVQALIRRVGFTVADLPLAVCCCAAGSALPSALFTGLRYAVLRFRMLIRSENSKNWETVRGDVLSLTDFGRM